MRAITPFRRRSAGHSFQYLRLCPKRSGPKIARAALTCMNHDDRSVAVSSDELDALSFFLPEHDLIAAGRLPPVKTSCAAGLNETNNHRGSVLAATQRPVATGVVTQHCSPIPVGQQRRQPAGFRKLDVFTTDILTTIAIRAVSACRWTRSALHWARLHNRNGIARTRTSLRAITVV